jgi:arsenite methyltransferase
MQTDVQKYYGETLKNTKDLQTSACCPIGTGPKHLTPYLKNIHEDVLNKFYGCGSPLPENLLGKTVLDLGCGTGRDCYIASQMVGEKGFVIGVDMTENQLATAKETLPWHMEKFGYTSPNTSFHLGNIEDLNFIETNSVDVVISNCVINLAEDKEKVFAEIYRVLKTNGELRFSDVYGNKEIPQILQKDPVLWGECLTGALTLENFDKIIKNVGFKNTKQLSKDIIALENKDIQNKLKGYVFESITYSVYKNKQEKCGC